MKEKPRWSVYNSVFAQRKRENESRDIFNTTQVTRCSLSVGSLTVDISVNGCEIEGFEWHTVVLP